ncbi:MAG: penicillin-binding protein [Paenibacillaceae bacterium]|nr:penicillin-binding protein [Paenibacillaceae bacterium]
MKPMDQRRLFLFLLGVTAVLLLYAGRLFVLQVLPMLGWAPAGGDLAAFAVKQRTHAFVIDTGRGDFYDRFGSPITGRTAQGLLVFPAAAGAATDEADERQQLIRLLHTNERQWQSFAAKLKQPQLWPQPNGEPLRLTPEQAGLAAKLHVAGATLTSFRERYPEPFAAGQLVGFMAQHPERLRTEFANELSSGRLALAAEIGAAGLERTFQSYLQGVGATSIALFRDGRDNPLNGLHYRRMAPGNDKYPLRIETTLHLEVQRQIEAMLQRRGIAEGAVVVLDAANADVVAMASRPAFVPDEPIGSADSWANRALQAMPPGSIYKTVVAAALLDEKLVRSGDTFECAGELGRFGFSCWQPGGHGEITLREAYAESCNIAFAKAMKPLSSRQLATYAAKLGVLGTVGWQGKTPGQAAFSQFDAEQECRLFEPATLQDDEGVRAQTAIGQRDVRLTPLAAANLVVTLLGGGAVCEPRVVSRIAYATGEPLFTFDREYRVKRGHGITPATAVKLAGWMRDVVDHGTGQNLQRAKWKLAGKSGTAQEAPVTKGLVSQWFIGYGPAAKPLYAVAVALPHMPSGTSGEAQAVFREVFDILATKNQNE